MTEEKSSPTNENPSPVNYITEEILEKICHTVATQLFSGEEPMGLYADHDEARLQASLALPRQVTFGKELYPGIFKKAAVLFYALNRNHAFSNGNKRLSVAALIVFLHINEWIMDADDTALRDLALWLAQTPDPIDKVVDELEKWIGEYSVPMAEYEKRHGITIPRQ